MARFCFFVLKKMKTRNTDGKKSEYITESKKKKLQKGVFNDKRIKNKLARV